MKRTIIISALCMLAVCSLSSCRQKVQTTTDNPHAFITSAEKVQSITTLKELDPDRLYEMDYKADYRLDDAIDADVTDIAGFVKFLAAQIMDVAPSEELMSAFSAGCSAYAATEVSTGDFLFGRNYDYCHVEDGQEVPITALFVRTAPEGGKKSISMVDTYWLGFHKGFYNDGQTDVSMLVGAPYVPMDGVNEDGFGMCVLHLNGKATSQDEPGKKPLWTNLVIRKLLDNASTVEEALDMVKDYNVTMVTPATGSFHFFLADATGDYAILEYSYPDADSVETSLPNVMKVFKGHDCDRYVTNFYVDPTLAENTELGPLSKKGLWRYDTLRVNLAKYGYKPSEAQAIDLLKAVSQDSKPDENTSHTQWSCLYNLTRKTVDISILQEFENKYSFSVE